MINKVILLGNLGADPEVRHLESGSTVAKIRVATNRNYRDKSTGEWHTDTQWHNVVAWRMLAERAERDLKKGSLVYVEGELKHRKYQDREGNDRYITEVEAYIIKPLDRKESSGTMESEKETYSTSTNQATESEGNEPEMDDDLPF